MKKLEQKQKLKLILLALVIALVAVVGYIVWQEYQYGVSEEYYESLRNTGCLNDLMGVKRL